jgi:hypothetical protein
MLFVVFCLTVRHSVWAARCPSAMVEQPIPDRSVWQAWPVLPGLAGYEVVDLSPERDLGLTSWRPHAMTNARLAGRGVCSERGASVASWFGQYFTASSGDDWTIRLRQAPSSGVVVVTGERSRPSAESIEPKPVVAFRIARDGVVERLLRVWALPLIVLGLFVAELRRSGT